jgi:eukaryotic-like serine/threonine-protein kinase
MRDIVRRKGRKLGGFRILALIDHGEYGIVYRAENPHTLQEVALKHVPKNKGREVVEAHRRGAQVQKILGEADPVGRVVRIHSWKSINDGLLIEMEEAFGEKLEDKLRGSAANFAFPLKLKIAKDIFEVLTIAHELNGQIEDRPFNAIVHGDLKPSNIFVYENQIKFIDFGSSKEIQKSGTLTKGDYGTTHYCSPERIEDGNLTIHVDLWAAGIIFYEMSVGDLPYSREQRETREKLEVAIRSRRPVAFPETCTCPTPLQAVISKILAPDLADRYHNAAEVVADLEAFTRGEQTVAESQLWVPQAESRSTQRTTNTDVSHREHKDSNLDDTRPTRRTTREKDVQDETNDDIRATHRTPQNQEVVPPTPAPVHDPPKAPVPSAKKRKVSFKLLVVLIIVVPLISALLFLLNEITVRGEAVDLANQISIGQLSDPEKAWNTYGQLRQRSYLRFGIVPAKQPVKEMLVKSTDRILTDYLNDYPTVTEVDYEIASSYLDHALEFDSADDHLKAKRLYCQGHIDRKAGEAKKKEGKIDEALARFNSAIYKLNEAVKLKPNWSDPHLALARIYCYGLADPENGKRELSEADRYDHHAGKRDKALLADAYYGRARALLSDSKRTKDADAKKNLIERAEQDCENGIALYQGIVPFAESLKNLNAARDLLNLLHQRRQEIENPVLQTDEQTVPTTSRDAARMAESADCKIIHMSYIRPNLTLKFFYAGHYSYEFEDCNKCPPHGEVEIRLSQEPYTSRILSVSPSGPFTIRINRAQGLVCYKTFGR